MSQMYGGIAALSSISGEVHSTTTAAVIIPRDQSSTLARDLAHSCSVAGLYGQRSGALDQGAFRSRRRSRSRKPFHSTSGSGIQVAAERSPNGLPEPYSDDPSQWVFHGHPCGSVVWDC